MSAPEVPGYRLIEHAGAGAFGQVWRAEHEQTGAPVAIKLMPPHPRPRVDAFRLAEIRATAALDHPNIVRSVDTGSLTDGVRWLALEWCGGGTLTDVSDWPTLERAIGEVLAGLAHAHSRHVVHRDIKPGNVLRASAGAFKIADFGVASLEGENAEARVGSPSFIAPEVTVRGGRQGPWTDLYELGATIWAVSTGGPLFPGDANMQLRAHRTTEPPAFHPKMPVPPMVEPWLRWLLAKEPTERPGSAAEALCALDRTADLTTLPDTWSPDLSRGRDARLRDAGLALLPFREPSLQGRGDELDVLWEMFRRVVDEKGPRVCVLCGPPGVGRARLGVEIGKEGVRRGAAVWVEVSAEDGMQGLSDALGGPDVDGALAAWQGDGAGVVVVRDVDHHSDAAAFGELCSRVSGPVLWVLTAQSVPRALVRRLPGDLWQAMDVEPLERHSQAALIDQALGLVPELRSKLVRRSAGLPALALGSLLGWVEQGRLEATEDGFALAEEGVARGTPSGLIGPLEVLARAGGSLPEADWSSACDGAGLVIDWADVNTACWTRDLVIRGRGSTRTVAFPPSVEHGAPVDRPAEDARVAAACAELLQSPREPAVVGMLRVAIGDLPGAMEAYSRAVDAAALSADRGRGLALAGHALAVAEQAGEPEMLWGARTRYIAKLFDVHRAGRVRELLHAWHPDLELASVQHRARFWMHFSRLCREEGRLEEAVEFVERGAAVVERARAMDSEERSGVLQALASQAVSLGRLDLAESLATEGLRLAESDHGLAYVNLTLGRARSFRGDAIGAVRFLTAAARHAKAAGHVRVEIVARGMLGETASRDGNPDAAERHFRVALERARSIPSYDVVMLEVNLLANLARQRRWEEVLAQATELGFDPRARRVVVALAALVELAAVAAAGLQRWDEAATHLTRLEELLGASPKLADPDFTSFAELLRELCVDGPDALSRRAVALHVELAARLERSRRDED